MSHRIGREQVTSAIEFGEEFGETAVIPLDRCQLDRLVAADDLGQLGDTNRNVCIDHVEALDDRASDVGVLVDERPLDPPHLEVPERVERGTRSRRIATSDCKAGRNHGPRDSFERIPSARGTGGWSC